MRRCLAIALSALLAATGCGFTAPEEPDVPAQERAAIDAPARGIATDQRGDRATITIGVGEPRPAAELNDASVAACRVHLDSLGGLESAVAIPIEVTSQLTSSPATDVVVRLDVNSVGEGGSVGMANQLTLWGSAYSDTPPQCQGPAAGIGKGAVRFSGDGSGSWRTWLVLAGAITPDDRSGAVAAGAIVLNPLVQLGGSLASFKLEPPIADSVVECSALDPAAGTINYVAVVPAGALQHGCTARGGSPAAGRICQAAYPHGNQKTVENVTTSNREASLQQICEGFGLPDGVPIDGAVQCALIAGATDLLPSGIGRSADRLCQATEIVDALASGEWLRAGGALACDFFSGVFATGAGVMASTAGPGGVVIGIAAYEALSAGLDLACDGLLNGNLGARLESQHEANVAMRVLHEGLCIQRIGSDVNAAPCP